MKIRADVLRIDYPTTQVVVDELHADVDVLRTEGRRFACQLLLRCLIVDVEQNWESWRLPDLAQHLADAKLLACLLGRRDELRLHRGDQYVDLLFRHLQLITMPLRRMTPPVSDLGLPCRPQRQQPSMLRAAARCLNHSSGPYVS